LTRENPLAGWPESTMRLDRDWTALFRDRKLRYAMVAPAANPAPATRPKRQAANRANVAPSIRTKRSILGMAAEKKRSAGVSAGAAGGTGTEFMSCTSRGSTTLEARALTHSEADRSPESAAPPKIKADESLVRMLFVRFVAGQSRSHANHLHESHDRTKDDPGEIEPLRVQPVVQEAANRISQKNCCRDNKPNLGVARGRY